MIHLHILHFPAIKFYNAPSRSHLVIFTAAADLAVKQMIIQLMHFRQISIRQGKISRYDHRVKLITFE